MQTHRDGLFGVMVVVHREAGLRFVIYRDDHAPAHVHVWGDGEAKIGLSDADGSPILISSDGLKAGDIRKAMRIVARMQAELVKRWREIHG